jgi:hypothetical protein
LILVLFYIYRTNIPPIMIINRIYETHNLLLLSLVSFLVGLRTYQHPCIVNSMIGLTKLGDFINNYQEGTGYQVR